MGFLKYFVVIKKIVHICWFLKCYSKRKKNRIVVKNITENWNVYWKAQSQWLRYFCLIFVLEIAVFAVFYSFGSRKILRGLVSFKMKIEWIILWCQFRANSLKTFDIIRLNFFFVFCYLYSFLYFFMFFLSFCNSISSLWGPIQLLVIQIANYLLIISRKWCFVCRTICVLINVLWVVNICVFFSSFTIFA